MNASPIGGIERFLFDVPLMLMHKFRHFFSAIPRPIRWIVSVQLFAILLLMACRICFFIVFRGEQDMFQAAVFMLGFRYDARLVAGIGLFMLVFGGIPLLNPYRAKAGVLFWNGFVFVMSTLLLIVYISDFYHYDYLKQRLNASVIQFADDAAISFKMVWQTYPVIPMTLLLMAVVFLLGQWHRIHFRKNRNADPIPQRKWSRALHYGVYSMILGVLVFGRVGQYPLRWSDAYIFSDSFKSATALNPVQSFVSSMAFRDVGFNVEKVKAGYADLSRHFGVDFPDAASLDFSRTSPYTTNPDTPMNVVLVICESFAASKSSMFGNALNPTPYFDSLSKQGLFYERCFTPAFGTARGVWSIITGIPDVTRSKTASRNPAAVDQYTLLNAFDAYDKYYFLGGSTTWANIRGLLKNNVNDLNIIEEDDFKADRADVWGISDKNLFLEANRRIRSNTKPFFAIIQTADNHRPYTIPEEDLTAFQKQTFSKDVLKKNGFEDNEQFNAFRYSDYCFRVFMETAKKEPYYANTLFVFVGDHGLRGDAGAGFPASFTQSGIVAEHVPLLFFAPQKVSPARIKTVCSQLDVLPSIAALTKMPHVNKTMGINLMADSSRQYPHAFIADPDMHTIGIVTDSFYYSNHLPTGQERLYSVMNDNPVPDNPRMRATRLTLSRLATAWYETSGYLILNNKKGK